jgi:hypothetical protein
MTPEFDSRAAHEACAPLHWGVEEWDFWAWLEDDESVTDGKDLQFLLDGELEDEDDDDDESWDGYDSSSGEEEDDESTEGDPTAGSFLRVGRLMKTTTETMAGALTTEPIVMTTPPVTTVLEMMAATGVAAPTSPPIKRRRFLGTYWW